MENIPFYAKAIFMLFCTHLIAIACFGQVDVTATGGTTSASYTTVKDAFDAINSGTHTGVITIGISGSTTESATASLNASGSGSASYSKITVSPTGGAARSISGTIAGPIIDLNGADNVVIDGLNTSGNTLTISNADVGSTSTCTIRFINDATTNKITNCTITGSSTSTSLGTIYFSTAISTGSPTGNDNDTISNCTIKETGTNLPTNDIYCGGTSTSGQENSGDVITGCNIANFFNASIASNGILISAGGTGWTIINNKLYQEAKRTYTAIAVHGGISVQTGDGYTISFNTIGYASSSGTGTYAMTGLVAYTFVGIGVSVGTTNATSIQGNIVTAFSDTNASGASTGNGTFCGIGVSAGNVNVGTTSGNTIGAASGTGAISVATGNPGAVIGINATAGTTGTISVQNNTIGSINVTGTNASLNCALHGIYIGSGATSITVSGNTIGNATTNNMVAGVSGSTTGNTAVSGIDAAFSSGTGNPTFSGNTIQNLTSYGTGSAGYVRGIWTGNASVTFSIKIKNNTVKNLTSASPFVTIANGLACAAGIHTAEGTNDTISGNTIYNISATNTGTGDYYACGISHNRATSTVIYDNIIYGITNAGTSTTTTAPPVIVGISIRSGTTGIKIYNNMISLGNSVTTNTHIAGIMANEGQTPTPTCSIYFNTVNIEGTVASGALPSLCFERGDMSTTQRTGTIDVRNNIFTNTRSGGSGSHYAIGDNINATSGSSSAGWGTNASDYNILNANSSTIGFWSANKTFSAWQTASASDAHSYSGITVTYTNSANDLHLNMGTTATNLESGGVAISGFTTDIDGDTRPGPTGSVNLGGTAPDIGADEFDGVPTGVNTWTGTSSTDWNTAGNWSGGVVPASTDNVCILSGTVTNEPTIASDNSIKGLVAGSGRTISINSGKTLSVAGSLSNYATINGSGKVSLNGSSQQNIGGTGTIATLELNNSSGATILSGSNISISSTYLPTSGTLTTNSGLTLLSTSGGTATISQGSSSGGFISGNVTVQQYIPGGRRAVRFFAHPFSSAIGLSQLEDNIDVTGSGGSTNGFTTTASNNPSAFWYDQTKGDGSTVGYDSGWTAFSNANGAGANAWNKDQGIRVLVRGSKGQTGSLTGGTYTPAAATIDMSGPVNQGTHTVSMTKGSGTPFYFIGNPYPCQIDLSLATLGGGVDANFDVWNPSTGTYGAYESNPFSSSYILPAYSGFFVSLSSSSSITFHEADKSSSAASSTLFRTTASAPQNKVDLRVLSNHDSLQWDRLTLYFDNRGKADSEWYDGTKFFNPDMSFYSFSADHKMLSIDVRPAKDGDVIPLGIQYAPLKDYVIKTKELNLPAGATLKLHDKYTGTVQTLSTGAEYAFSITADSNSQGDNRFELNVLVAPANVPTINTTTTSLKMAIAPNPASEEAVVSFSAANAGITSVQVVTVTGQEVLNMDLGKMQKGSIKIPMQNMAAGVYLVNLHCGNETQSEQLIKK